MSTIKIGPFTLPTSKQEMFDVALSKLVEQGRPSRKEICKYREDETATCTTRCAAGHFILDEDYTCDLEENLVDSLPCWDDQSEHLDFLKELQTCHDLGNHASLDWVSDFKKRMKALAIREGLNYPEEDDTTNIPNQS